MSVISESENEILINHEMFINELYEEVQVNYPTDPSIADIVEPNMRQFVVNPDLFQIEASYTKPNSNALTKFISSAQGPADIDSGNYKRKGKKVKSSIESMLKDEPEKSTMLKLVSTICTNQSWKL